MVKDCERSFRLLEDADKVPVSLFQRHEDWDRAVCHCLEDNLLCKVKVQKSTFTDTIFVLKIK